jgi:hypothetical protein
MADAEVDTKLQECMSLVPQESIGWPPERALAEDASVAVAYALRSRKTGLSQEAAWAARVAYEAVDNFVSNQIASPSSTWDEERILSHRLTQAELQRQNRDLEDLESQNIAIEQLRSRAKKESVFSPNDLETIAI